MQTITTNQNKRLHKLLSEMCLKEEKATLVAAHTEGRTEHSSEMYDFEAMRLISTLEVEKLKRRKKLVPASLMPEKQEGQKKEQTDWERKNRIRRKMCSLAHILLWKTEEGKADMKRIDGWCANHGKFKKKLNEHTYNELVELATQFEQMTKKHLLRLNEKSQEGNNQNEKHLLRLNEKSQEGNNQNEAQPDSGGVR